MNVKNVEIIAHAKIPAALQNANAVRTARAAAKKPAVIKALVTHVVATKMKKQNPAPAAALVNKKKHRA